MIRQATISDLDSIMQMVDQAKIFMNNMGNFQWDVHYPYREVFENDIIKNSLFVDEHKNRINSCICLNNDQPPEYANLKWVSPDNSLIIHRLVVDNQAKSKGVGFRMMQFAEEFAIEHQFDGLRSDTNERNIPMLKLFFMLGYYSPGKIRLRNLPNPFICFEKIFRR